MQSDTAYPFCRDKGHLCAPPSCARSPSSLGHSAHCEALLADVRRPPSPTPAFFSAPLSLERHRRCVVLPTYPFSTHGLLASAGTQWMTSALGACGASRRATSWPRGGGRWTCPRTTWTTPAAAAVLTRQSRVCPLRAPHHLHPVAASILSRVARRATRHALSTLTRAARLSTSRSCSSPIQTPRPPPRERWLHRQAATPIGGVRGDCNTYCTPR